VTTPQTSVKLRGMIDNRFVDDAGVRYAAELAARAAGE
jgi:hypothetical protein